MAQLGLRVTAPGSVTVNSNFTYVITVTSQGQGFTTVQVTSEYSPSLEFVSATQNANVSSTPGNNSVSFLIQQLPSGSNEVLNLTLRPRVVTTVTNAFAATIGQFVARTNVSTTVTETPGTADVAVSIVSPPPVFVDDWAAFTVSLVNRGGGTVSGIFLTNTFTNAPVTVRDYKPSGGGSIVQNPTRLILNVGSLAAGQSTNYHITIQPRGGSNVVLRSNFRFAGNADTNSVNNTATATLTVLQPSTTNRLKAEIASSQVFNPQNALMEQRITVTNEGPNVARNARVIISNATFRVVNAVGTNNAHPFVLHAAPIQPGETVELLLEYFIPDREPRLAPKLIAYATSEVAPPARVNGSFTNFASAVWREPFGSMTESNLVLYFRSEPGATYELQYSSHIDFTNALRALPLIRAQANSTVFIDYGPPKTISRPRREITIATNSEPVFDGTNIVAFTNVYVTNLNMRFYRAMKLP